MLIEHARLDDARAIAQIHVETWRVAYAALLSAEYLAGLSIDARETVWRNRIAAGEPEVLVARDGGVVQGWLSFDRCRDSDASDADGEVWALYVAPASWSTGAGRRLWLRTRERMQQRGFTRCRLWVFPQNERAIRFYRAAGFSAEPESTRTFELGGRQLEETRYVCSLVDGT